MCVAGDNLPPPLFRLPIEIRQRILYLALARTDTIQLYFPVWHKYSVLNPPLFRVCRFLREEAIEAFYQSNSFLWIIGPEASERSNPILYPIVDGSSTDAAAESNSRQLTPCLPWQYPNIFWNLRHIRLEVYVTCIYDDQEEFWHAELVSRLQGFVTLLDKGRKLQSFHLTVHAYCALVRPALTPELVAALEHLTALEIRGNLVVDIATNDTMSREIFERTDLEARMKQGAF